ncbi:hypothetical protein J1N35_044506 [Gossypium stocksii]|uniref:Uncharacterized protein n=1 Tax=Gossypium stocksii TaxID=47602 RepID=A0A9D3ZGB1_9ROSI|nr:hypothetical protein J1N35_044506 [Gossypium stocksii]
MVVLVTITGFEVKRIHVNNGNVVEVLSWNTYRKMGLKEQALSKASPLYGFTNHLIEGWRAHNHEVCLVPHGRPPNGIQCHLWAIHNKDGKNGGRNILYENQVFCNNKEELSKFSQYWEKKKRVY